MKTPISFVQPNFQTGPKHLNAFYLPYTSGVLWAYARQNKKISNNFNVDYFVYKRHPFENNFNRVKDSQILFFSVYVWNYKYCLQLAKEVKEHNPEALILFGGPQLPYSDSEFFDKYPYVDSICVGEGEHVVEQVLLDYLDNKPIEKIVRAERIKDMKLPSPYLDGVFDELMAEHPEVLWNPTLETDRGCPYKCTFCDWGGLTNSKVYKFELDRVFAEIEWFAKHEMDFITMTTANFGIFKERDGLIVDKMIEECQKTGFPKKMTTSWAKNGNAEVFDMIKRFKEGGVSTSFTLSLQTTNDQVLENIKRKNMAINNVREITEHARKNEIPVSTELILGLPGESYESWKKTLSDILDYDLHNGLDIYFLNMIENAPIRSDIEKYQIETFTAYDMFNDTTDFEDIQKNTAEGVEVLKSTSTMNEDQLIDSFAYTWKTIGLHSYGITDIIAIYLHKKIGIEYYEFYEKLFEEVFAEEEFNLWETELKQELKKWHDTGFYDVTVGEDIKVYSWQLPHHLGMLTHYNQSIGKIQDIVINHIEKYYNIDPNIIDDYITLNEARLKTWGNYIDRIPKHIETKTNLMEYISGREEYSKKPVKYIVYDRIGGDFPTTLERHTDSILYGRHRLWYLNVLEKLS